MRLPVAPYAPGALGALGAPGALGTPGAPGALGAPGAPGIAGSVGSAVPHCEQTTSVAFATAPHSGQVLSVLKDAGLKHMGKSFRSKEAGCIDWETQDSIPSS